MNFPNNLTDAGRLLKLGTDNLNLLYRYAEKALDRAQSGFIALDSKASQTISMIAVVSGILVLIIKLSNLISILSKIILFFTILFFISAILCCLLCLRVRSILQPPSISRAIDWTSEHEKKILSDEIFAALIVDHANAEVERSKISEKKAKYLLIGQYFEVIGIIFLFIFFSLYLF